MGNYMLSNKQVEKILRFNLNKAIERAFKRIMDEPVDLVEKELKDEVRRIMKGEMIYWPTENDLI